MSKEVNLPIEELEIKIAQGEIIDEDKYGSFLIARDFEFYDEAGNRLHEDIFNINKD